MGVRRREGAGFSPELLQGSQDPDKEIQDALHSLRLENVALWGGRHRLEE